MQGTVHILVGAAIALLIPDLPTMIATSLFSHYLLDITPHIDPDTFASSKLPYTFTQRVALTVDILVTLMLIAALFLLHERSANVVLGAIVSLLPDLLAPLEQYASFSPFKRFHYIFHWEPKRARYWSWYISGILLPLAVSAASLAVILNY